MVNWATAYNNGNQRRSIIVYHGSRSTPHTSYQEGVRRGVIPANVIRHAADQSQPLPLRICKRSNV